MIGPYEPVKNIAGRKNISDPYSFFCADSVTF